MKYIQVGELGKAALVGNKDALPTPGILFLNKFYVASNTGIIYTCKVENDVYSWKVAATLPELTNGITSPTQLKEGVEAIDANGNKVTGTMKFVEKTAYANGTYYPDDDNAQGYSKFIVDIAGETAENPYVATTEAEMRAYLAEEYAGSFVRFENARYRNITLPYLLSNVVTMGAFDTYLAQSRMNKYIDYWTVYNNNRKIFSSNGRQTFTILGTSVYQDVWHNIYAYKYRNSDGSYCRALVGTVHILMQGDTNPDYIAFLLYIDGYIANDTVFPNYPDDYEGSTLTGTIGTVDENSISYSGWYQEGYPDYTTDIAPDYVTKPGYRTMSWSITEAHGNNGVVTYLYSDAALIIYSIFQQYGTADETSQLYKELGVYRVNKKVESIPKWTNAQPLQVGDTYAGATLYFNTNLSYDDVVALISTIPDSEFNQGLSAVFNMDNPVNFNDENVLYKAYLGILIQRVPGTFNSLLSMSIDGDDFNIITKENGWRVTSLLFKPSLDGVTQDATITKINYPDIVGQLVGKSATFTKGTPEPVTTYSLELMLDAGEIDEWVSPNDAASFNDFIKTSNIGKIVRLTGYADPGYKKGALYILTED